MRLICTINSEKYAEDSEENPFAFSQLLSQHGIENTCEEVSLPDHPTFYRIWVAEEDKMHSAQKLYQEYQKNPSLYPFTELSKEEIEEDAEHLPPPETLAKKSPQRKPAFLSPAPYGKITLFFLILCGLLYIWGELGRSDIPPKIPGVVDIPLFSPVYKALLFDYPHYFTLRDKLLKTDLTALKENKPLPVEAKKLLQELKTTPFWQGGYLLAVDHIKNPQTALPYQGPLFEKIGQGEVWRVFTPAVLHFNFLHIFFNILWFILLGNQIEFRIGAWRYLFLILVTAIVANVAQYLMSGSVFLGLSGVVIGLAGFIWARQQKAPWEGYLFNKSTLLFLGAFVFGMCLLQILFFILEIWGKYQGTLPIANTAHIVGGGVGYLLGRLSLFKLQKNSTS